jgi:Ca2+-binding EF-hand superfamily protein
MTKMNNQVITMLLMAAAAMAMSSPLQAAEPELEEIDKFELADFDGNGCISFEELRNRGVIVFDSLDVNGDGVISDNEHIRAVNEKGEEVTPEAVDLSRFTLRCTSYSR